MAPSTRGIRGARQLFNGDRLRLARELRGYSQHEVGQRSGVSGAAISQFELGDSKPSTMTLSSLAEVLDFPASFFAKDFRQDNLRLPAFFRSLRSTSVTERREARAFVELVRQFALGLERHVNLPEHDVPGLPADPRHGREEIEAIAGKVRRQWGLPSGEPIKNMVALLEGHGAIAARVSFETEKMDAFSVPYEDRPVVVLCADKGKKDRSRFDAAHELGHLVMHASSEEPPTKVMEDQAHQFAAGFLMPAEGIYDELPAGVHWDRVLELKRRWGTSMASILYRARRLGKLEEIEYVRATKAMSARGWRIDEPGDLGAPESPVVLRRAVELLSREGLTVEEIAEDTALPLDQVRRILEASAATRPEVVV
jgi:Zn-dependent peptidase ImmA (M78 family)/DNA-binding XRE family transcriptional regulator